MLFKAGVRPRTCQGSPVGSRARGLDRTGAELLWFPPLTKAMAQPSLGPRKLCQCPDSTRVSADFASAGPKKCYLCAWHKVLPMTRSVHDEAPSEFLGNPAEVAEKYLRRSVHLNHRNKLPHANRCLLYATAYFRKKKDNELFLDKARASGREALRLDPRYINGHRDLAMSLLRYRQFDEAYEYSAKALRLADNPEKRHELRQDLLAVFDELKARPDANAADEEQQSRWEQSLARAIAGLNQERDPPTAAAAATTTGRKHGKHERAGRFVNDPTSFRRSARPTHPPSRRSSLPRRRGTVPAAT